MDENKYFETLKQYDLDLDDEKVKRQVENLLKRNIKLIIQRVYTWYFVVIQ